MAVFFRRHYFNESDSIVAGAPAVEWDIDADLLGQGRDSIEGPAQYLRITTDVVVIARINSATADAITIPIATAAVPFWEMPRGAMQIATVWLENTAACGSGDATVTVLAV